MFAAAENSRELNPAIYVPRRNRRSNTQARRQNAEPSDPSDPTNPVNNTNYHSLQFNLEKRFSHGYTILASYTWSKKMDDYNWTNPYNRRFDYGLSREDVPHNWKFSNVWQIPEYAVEGFRRQAREWLDAQ